MSSPSNSTCKDPNEGECEETDREALLSCLRKHNLNLDEFRALMEENSKMLHSISELCQENAEAEKVVETLSKKLIPSIFGETMKAKNENNKEMLSVLEIRQRKEVLLQRYVDLKLKYEDERAKLASEYIIKRQVDFQKRQQSANSDEQKEKEKLNDKITELKNEIVSLEVELSAKQRSLENLQGQLTKFRNLECPNSSRELVRRDMTDE